MLKTVLHVLVTPFKEKFNHNKFTLLAVFQLEQSYSHSLYAGSDFLSHIQRDMKISTYPKPSTGIRVLLFRVARHRVCGIKDMSHVDNATDSIAIA